MDKKTSDQTFYIILIAIILFVIYLFWQKNQKTQQQIDNLLSTQNMAYSNQPSNSNITTQSNNTNGMEHMSSIQDKENIIDKELVALNKLLTDMDKQLNVIYNALQVNNGKQLSLSDKSEIDKLIKYVNMNIVNPVTKIINTLYHSNNNWKINNIYNSISTYNTRIISINNLLLKITDLRFLPIQIPSNNSCNPNMTPIPIIPAIPAQPNSYKPVIPIIPAQPNSYKPTFNCKDYNSIYGNYCTGQPYGNTQHCYIMGKDTQNNTVWGRTVGNTMCNSDEQMCQFIQNKCNNKPMCDDVDKACNLNSNIIMNKNNQLH